MDLYEILELKTTASEADIKKAYYKLSKIYHPDKNSDPQATERFQKIHSAYEILSNNQTREEYLKMNSNEKINFIEILEKIIKENIDLEELNKYNIKFTKSDLEYLEVNFFNFIKNINIKELIDLFKKGKVNKKDFSSVNCSESDVDIYDEHMCDYYHHLPIVFQKNNVLDIKIELNINISDVININKKKIKIKRQINNENITSTFLFKLNNPFIVFYGGGDMKNDIYGNLIIKLKLPNNITWSNEFIFIEQNITLYEMVYGLNINLDLGEEIIKFDNWVPCRDGIFIQINEYIKLKLILVLTDEQLLSLSLT